MPGPSASSPPTSDGSTPNRNPPCPTGLLAAASRVTELNEALASVRISPGDFYAGSVAPARFAEQRGWATGTSGPSERYPQGEYAQTWASTGPYPDPPNALPPRQSIEALASDGILVWVGLTRDARLAPDLQGGAFQAKEPPYRLDDLERVDVWEGQVRDVPEYRLWAVSERGDQVDLRVYFGRADPTDSMLAEADAMLAGLEFPDWGLWELA